MTLLLLVAVGVDLGRERPATVTSPIASLEAHTKPFVLLCNLEYDVDQASQQYTSTAAVSIEFESER